MGEGDFVPDSNDVGTMSIAESCVAVSPQAAFSFDAFQMDVSGPSPCTRPLVDGVTSLAARSAGRHAEASMMIAMSANISAAPRPWPEPLDLRLMSGRGKLTRSASGVD
ncbi:unannotated protein [freshwater metagenome]|uniref:Unannotated protein n=1 Tax=freshwater metagenome TaxID=449393 RepID=A0A6J7IY87_9ZZZZ